MSTLRANTLKPITSGNSLVLQGDSGGSGVSGPSIDSNGDVDFSQNTNAKVKLPSGGGIYESNGSTEILTESGGVVTLKNTTIDETSLSNGMVVKSGFKLYTDGDHQNTTATEEASLDYYQISCTVGNTIVFNWFTRFKAGANSSTTARYSYLEGYQNTSSVSRGATSGLGTMLSRYLIGTSVATASTSGTNYIPANINSAFVATSTTHYLGLILYGTSVTYAEIAATSTTPTLLSYYELKGDVLT